jgi:hypothetical protein
VSAGTLTEERVNRMPAKPISWDIQVGLWGYALFGDTHGAVLEFVACMVEGKLYQDRAWDRDHSWLDSTIFDGGRPPDHWALPWVMEDRLRREYPGWRGEPESTHSQSEGE